MDDYNRKIDLYPRLEPFAHGVLAVDGLHKIYWEQSGNPHGTPVVFLHGGPGAGAIGAHRRFFDPRHYRIVIFDQRGSGRSKPYAELTDNTTDHLIGDMELLRQFLEIDKWMVFGGSWGASLALAYGIRHPDRCLGFVLRGVFLCRQREMDWFLHGMGMVFPEAWRAFTEFLPARERDDPLEGYYRRLVDPDPAVHLPAARMWSAYESACSNLMPKADPGGRGEDGRATLGVARIEAHYFKHAMFMEEGYLLDNVAALRGIPAVIVQGRYDIVCPIVSADELARAWPEAEYVIVGDAGHSAMEPGIRSALVRATEALKTLL